MLTIDWYLAHEEWMNHVTSGNYQKYYEQMYKTSNAAAHLLNSAKHPAAALQSGGVCGILVLHYKQKLEPYDARTCVFFTVIHYF